LKLDVAQLLGD